MSLNAVAFASPLILYDKYIDNTVDFDLTINGVANNGFSVCEIPKNLVYLQVVYIADAYDFTTGPVCLIYQLNDNSGDYNWVNESRITSTPAGGPPKQFYYDITFLPFPATGIMNSAPSTTWTVSGGNKTYTNGAASSGSTASTIAAPLVKGGFLIFGTNGTGTTSKGQLTVLGRSAG